MIGPECNSAAPGELTGALLAADFRKSSEKLLFPRKSVWGLCLRLPSTRYCCSMKEANQKKYALTFTQQTAVLLKTGRHRRVLKKILPAQK